VRKSPYNGDKNGLQIAVGRLGVITEVELSIIPQDMVERQITTTSFWDFVDAMQVIMLLT
jgi:hypothetical protein